MNKKFLRIISLVLIICLLGAIFFLSSQTGTESGGLSDGITAKLIKAIYPGFSSLGESEQIHIFEMLGTVIRKLAHFSEYFLLGALLFIHLATYDTKNKCKLLISASAGTFAAATDEFHQYFVPGRGAGAIDVILDAFGVFCGILFIYLIINILKKKRSKSI